MKARWGIIFYTNYIEYVEIWKKIEKSGRKRVEFPSNRGTGWNYESPHSERRVLRSQPFKITKSSAGKTNEYRVGE